MTQDTQHGGGGARSVSLRTKVSFVAHVILASVRGQFDCNRCGASFTGHNPNALARQYADHLKETHPEVVEAAQ